MTFSIRQAGWRLLVPILLAAAACAWGAPVPSLPTVSAEYSISVYANVPEPMKLSFASDGSLYVGRQPGVRIHRVAPGGSPVAEYGPPMADPDAVLVDQNGHIGGRPRSVLVGGGGVLAAIFPDQSASVVFSGNFDVDDMKFDRHGRLIFSDDAPRVLVSSGGPPTVLFTTPDRPGSLAIDMRNRIHVALGDGTIRIYNPDGTLANGAFATGLAGLDTYLAFAPEPDGGLYVLSGTALLRFDSNGQVRTIGTGFVPGPSSGTGFIFGPDHALYVSDYSANRILRIARRKHP